MCFGSRGFLKDTYAVHLPWWWFHATASGYTDTEPSYLDVLENRRQVQRGDTFATIEISVPLQKGTAQSAR